MRGLPSNTKGSVRVKNVLWRTSRLGLVPSTKSKIEDGSTVGTLGTHRTAVADFISSMARALAGPPTFTSVPPGGRPVGVSLEAMDG